MKAYGNCSKNYVNCRKHPTRETSVSKRFNDDFRAYRDSVKKDGDLYKEQLVSARQNEEKHASSITRLRRKIRKNNTLLLATLPEKQYQGWYESEKSKIIELAETNQPFLSRENALNEVLQARNETISAIKTNVDKEIRLNSALERPLEGFKKATTQLMINEGSAFNPEAANPDDSRGVQDVTAEQHIRSKCAPAIITGYQENYSWTTTQEYQPVNESGAAARISCQCGEVYDQLFVLEDQGYNSMLERLMNSD